MAIAGFKSRGTSAGREVAGRDAIQGPAAKEGLQHGHRNCFGNKKTNSALRDLNCPGVDVARWCGNKSVVEQGFPDLHAQRTRIHITPRHWLLCHMGLH